MIRRAGTLRGTPGKHVLAGEEDVRRVSRQSLVAARDMAVGQVVNPADVTVQRPGTGIPAADVARAVGRRDGGRDSPRDAVDVGICCPRRDGPYRPG